jgi:hypothetical protein
MMWAGLHGSDPAERGFEPIDPWNGGVLQTARPVPEVTICDFKFLNLAAARWSMKSRIGGNARHPGCRFAFKIELRVEW